MAKIKSRRTPQKKTVLIVIFAITLLSAGSVSASILPMNTNLTKKIQGTITQPVSNVISELEQYYTQIKQTYLAAVLEKIGKYIDLGQENLNAAINDAIGALGLPDPFLTEDNVHKAVQQSVESIVGLNSGTQASHTANQAQDATAQAVIAAYLGKKGQAQAQAELQQVAQQAQTVQEAGQQAQSYNVSQDVLKSLAQQNAGQANILNRIYRQQGDLKTAALMSSTSLVKINQQLEQEKWLHQVDLALNQNGFKHGTDQYIGIFNAINNYKGGD